MNGSDKKRTVMVVDDVPIIIKQIVNILRGDYQVIVATNGAEALETATSQSIDLILLDVVMPEMDGFEVCRQLKKKEETCRIPIVFVTAETSEEEIAFGLSLGAHYYLTKPIQPKAIRAVIASALSDRDTSIHLLKKIRESAVVSTLCCEGKFAFRTMDEALVLAAFLANACPCPENAGIGLKELFFNAVEHGNLGITYEEKSMFCEKNQLKYEIDRRLALPENVAKCVTVSYQRKEKEIVFLISDRGLGFDWKCFMVFDPGRIFDFHGRGIALAKATSFDHIEYLGNGNEVKARIIIK